MPLRLEIKKVLTSRSDRVKSVDVHPTEPWILAALFSGHVFLWNYATESLVKSFEVTEVPVRTAKFIPRKQWFVCGADDMIIRVYNYNTMERVKVFEAHSDYIRSLAVHPTSPYVISASDDMSIKLWDWERDWAEVQIFEGHTHYVMQIEINPKDPNTFASASLDRTVKVWGLNSRNAHFCLEGHERGVNCVSYFSGGDRPYLASGADDRKIMIWDYQTKSCVATLEGHTDNISAVQFHPQLPLILTAAEDGTVRMWHSSTYRLENTLNYGMERCWAIGCDRDSNKVALGYDEGTVMIKIGHEEPVVSMDKNGKVIWAKNHEIVGTNVKTAELGEYSDGERLNLATKEMGSCEIYPQDISHDPKGRLVAACGDGEYIIYTALSLKNKCFGSALEFVWASQSGMYATRESSARIVIFKNFKEHNQFRPPFSCEGIFGGPLLGVRSSEFIDFYDWETLSIVRRIEVCPKQVYWSDSAEVVVLACDASYFMLSYNMELVTKYISQNVEVSEQGIEGAFDLEQEVSEVIRTGSFVGDCFLYSTASNRLCYYVGGEVMVLAHLDRPYFLLGYLPREDRVFLIDKSHNIISYKLLLSILVYETAIVRQDFESAASTLQEIPREYHEKIARFLEGQNLKEMALEVTTDIEHRFELALGLRKIDIAREIAEADGAEQKWKQLGDVALREFSLDTAIACFQKASDYSSLLFLSSALGNAEIVEQVAVKAKETGRFNIAFTALFMLGRIQECIELLIQTERLPEAAFMARSYAPSEVPRVVELWRASVGSVRESSAEMLADPGQHPDMFPEYGECCQAEHALQEQTKNRYPAGDYAGMKEIYQKSLLEALQEGSIPNFTPSSFVPNKSASPIRSPTKTASPKSARASSGVRSPQSAAGSQVRSTGSPSHSSMNNAQDDLFADMEPAPSSGAVQDVHFEELGPAANASVEDDLFAEMEPAPDNTVDMELEPQTDEFIDLNFDDPFQNGDEFSGDVVPTMDELDNSLRELEDF